MNKKWVIGTVNYKTESYLPWKLKMIYENEDKNDFTYVIVDNSPVHDTVFFAGLKEQYPEIVVIPHVPTNVNRTSGEHGQGLDIILNYARENNAEFLLVYDPDFFYVQKNMLKYYEAEFEQRKVVAIGAPYTIPLRHYDFNTPCAFGAAYTMKFLEGISFACHKDQHETMIEGKDVGWEIRQKLAQTGAQHLTFTQTDVPESEYVGGTHMSGMHYSFESILRQYFLWGKRVAYHLHRGSFDAPLGKFMENNWRSDRSTDLNQPNPLWLQTRNAYCEKYYNESINSQGMA